jgi:hypothetical protein
MVIEKLSTKDSDVVTKISKDLGNNPNIEMILSRVRSLANLVGSNLIHGYDGQTFKKLAENICDLIGKIVGPHLPKDNNSYILLSSWIGGADRKNPIEVFTPNYDLLMEEAFERLEIPYFDGFTGSYEPFFDPPSVSNNDLPSRWIRLWKLHGSLGWADNGKGRVIRGKGREAAQLIYPDHLKYDQIQKLPYTAFFDRLRKFLSTPDTLLVTCGFSYLDSHISSVIDESLSANPGCSVFAFQYNKLENEKAACDLATKRSNVSVYASDGALINCIPASWRLGELPSSNWEVIRTSFWGKRDGDDTDFFLLGDFEQFARFFSLIYAEQVIDADQSNEELK